MRRKLFLGASGGLSRSMRVRRAGVLGASWAVRELAAAEGPGAERVGVLADLADGSCMIVDGAEEL